MTDLVSVRDLSICFKSEIGTTEAVRGLTFNLRRGEITALVGESGSGKSVTANSLLGLLPNNVELSGEILFTNEDTTVDIATLSERDPRLRSIRGDQISMVFQEPMTALSPVHTIGDQISEAILCHQSIRHADAWQQAEDMLRAVGIPQAADAMHKYPFHFSGGMRQRAVIAMALVCHPALLICDEPTTALDVTVQAEILLLIRALHENLGNAVLFITHDLAVVAQIADRVLVMYQGAIVEEGDVRQVLKSPTHAYTQKLLAAVPQL
jgi:peptide/nickel transport system ATP-binding protein